MLNRLAWVFLRVFLPCFWALGASQAFGELQTEWSGRFEILHTLSIKNESSYQFFLRETGKTWKVLPGLLAEEDLLKVESGERVVISGSLFDDGTIIADNLRRLEARIRASAGPDIRRGLFLIVDFLDGKASDTYSVSSISNTFFAANNSANAFFKVASRGNFYFDSDADRDGNIDILPVSINQSLSCDLYSIADAADAKAQAAGINLSAFQHHIYLLPDNLSCGWAGIAHVGCYTDCSAWLKVGHDPFIYAHELGHNAGMHHASGGGQEYGDYSDPMGSPWRLMQYNAAHMDQMGWYAAPGMFTEVSSSGEYVLKSYGSAFDDQTRSGVIKIAKPDTSEVYYLSYRQPIGLDANTLNASYMAGVSLHTFPASKIGKTALLSVLGVGKSYRDEANKVTIATIATDSARGEARVKITFGDNPVDCSNTKNISIENRNLSLRSGAGGGLRLFVKNLNDEVCSNNFTMTFSLPKGVSRKFISPQTQAISGGKGSLFGADFYRGKYAKRGTGTVKAFINGKEVLSAPIVIYR